MKNKLFSAINLFGLAVGLMSCILIMLFVREEVGYDTWLPDHERVVRMHTTYQSPDRAPFLALTSAGRMMPAIRDYARTEVESAVRLIPFGMTIQKDGDAFRETIVMADPEMFDVFDLPFLHGSGEQSFTKSMDMIISERTAIKYFGRSDVVGETLTFCCLDDNTIDVAITGVIKNIPEASHFELDFLVYLEPTVFADSPNILETWTSVNTFTYFKMREGITLEQLQERISYWVNNESPLVEMMAERLASGNQDIPSDAKVTDRMKHRVMALTDLHLKARQHSGSMGDWKALGNITMIYTFSAVALLVLVIACINFMNLSTARASTRAREVAMRKVMGASRRQVALQFLFEAIALSFIALFFALVLVEAVLPLYNEALGRELEINFLGDMKLFSSLVGVALIVGVGAGLYPALYLSRFLPAQTLKANKSADTAGSSKLRAALVIFQFAISITLVVSTAVVYRQTLFVNNMDVGYKSDNKLVLNVRAAGNGVQALKQELAKISGVTDVSLSSEAPSQDHENNTNFKLLEQQDDGDNNQGIVINYHNMGFGFFEAYDVKPIAGRLFDENYGTDQVVPIPKGDERTGTASVILNLSAVRSLGFEKAEDAIGKTLYSDLFRGGKYNLTIIGVIPDLYFRSLKYGVRPTVYTMNPAMFRVASIGYNTNDLPTLMTNIEQTWKENIPLQPMHLRHLSEMMSRQYAEETSQATLFAAFSSLAILIACLGLYGLASFTAVQRTKEIGIRKVLGAKVIDIVKLLVWQFSKPVMLANLIAWPIAIYYMSDWLQGFEYRIDAVWIYGLCAIAGFVALIIAWGTVAGHAVRVARSKPIEALRYE